MSTRIRLTLAFAALTLCAAPSLIALDNGLALTPPMGWNSWNKFGCKDINENVVHQAADAMASTGMKDAGYRYIVIDDCWQISRDANGNIVPDSERFPSGIKALADYIHGKGLKFGIYSDSGTKTCAGRPGSWGYEFQDARQWAAWGADYVKYDWCNNGKQNSEAAYTLMRDALAKTGRPIVFSLCEWGSTKPWLWAKDVGNLWRATGDIVDCWDCKKDWGGLAWTKIIDLEAGLESYAGPGHWNDADMLEVGNGGLTNTEARAHFSLWAILASPLMAGNDIRNMTPETKEILLNKDVIAVDQDSLGMQGRKIRDDGDFEVWSKQLNGGNRAVALLNRSGAEKQMSVSWNELGYPDHISASVRDLWSKKDLGKLKSSFSATVPSHGVVMVKIEP